ncbi:MAG TPA: hypothetical protein VF985_10190 [Mariniflexile sp.]
MKGGVASVSRKETGDEVVLAWVRLLKQANLIGVLAENFMDGF